MDKTGYSHAVEAFTVGKRTVKLMAVGAAAMFVVACGSSEPAYQMITGDANSVSYTWDANEMSLDEITAMATEHCAQYTKAPTLESDTPSGEDNDQHTTIFKC